MDLLRIKFRDKDLQRLFRALNREMHVASREGDRLPYRHAVHFVNLLRNDVAANRFTHPPYSPDYARWKQKHARFQGPWKKMGDFLEALTVFKDHGKGWRGGIPASAKNSKGRSIAMYTTTLEYGLHRQKKRPVFVPTTEKYRNQNDLIARVNNQSKIRIKEAWK